MFMIHPVHGATNAEGSDIEANKKAGWKESTHEEWFNLTKPVKKDEDVKLDAPKRGRPALK